MSEEIKQILNSNPTWTYGMAVGYAIGRAAKLRGNKYESLYKAIRAFLSAQ